MHPLISSFSALNTYLPVFPVMWLPKTSFSHVFFVDDLFLLAKANHSNCTTIKSILDDFCTASGQLVNLQKSKVFFSKRVPNGTCDELSLFLGIPPTPNLGNYLGFPLVHHQLNKNTFFFLIDKVKKRLSSWKSHLLSMAGRVTLIKSVMSSLPNYYMQCMALPEFTCHLLDKINRLPLGFYSRKEESPHN